MQGYVGFQEQADDQGEFHGQGDAKWIVIRGQSRGHDDMPFGRPTPGRPIGLSPYLVFF